MISDKCYKTNDIIIKLYSCYALRRSIVVASKVRTMTSCLCMILSDMSSIRN